MNNNENKNYFMGNSIERLVQNENLGKVMFILTSLTFCVILELKAKTDAHSLCSLLS